MFVSFVNLILIGQGELDHFHISYHQFPIISWLIG